MLYFTVLCGHVRVVCRDVGRSWPAQPWGHEEMDSVPPHVYMWPPTFLPWERPFPESLHPRGCLFLRKDNILQELLAMSQ